MGPDWSSPSEQYCDRSCNEIDAANRCQNHRPGTGPTLNESQLRVICSLARSEDDTSSARFAVPSRRCSRGNGIILVDERRRRNSVDDGPWAINHHHDSQSGPRVLHGAIQLLEDHCLLDGYFGLPRLRRSMCAAREVRPARTWQIPNRKVVIKPRYQPTLMLLLPPRFPILSGYCLHSPLLGVSMMRCFLAAGAPEPILRPVWILSPFSLSLSSASLPAPVG